ncbi:hypothetical protein LX36DRAFT_741430 [Colletotrichum falcatum]|nr:hypothetical protein LX36DRAFT_741430 [Colletotrichum falcatum]
MKLKSFANLVGIQTRPVSCFLRAKFSAPALDAKFSYLRWPKTCGLSVCTLRTLKVGCSPWRHLMMMFSRLQSLVCASEGGDVQGRCQWFCHCQDPRVTGHRRRMPAHPTSPDLCPENDGFTVQKTTTTSRWLRTFYSPKVFFDASLLSISRVTRALTNSKTVPLLQRQRGPNTDARASPLELSTIRSSKSTNFFITPSNRQRSLSRFY